jgi:hypothetical protein
METSIPFPGGAVHTAAELIARTEEDRKQATSMLCTISKQKGH